MKKNEPAPDATQASASDKIANRYEIRRAIGAGGSGSVFQAWDLQLQRFVAVKRWSPPEPMLDDPEGPARLWRERALRARDPSPRDSPVLLAISLSANDYIGHWFGPDSYEAWDELLRLDVELAGFFCELDRRQGPEHWSLVLSSDHGVLPLPEVNRALGDRSSTLPVSNSRPTVVGSRVLAANLMRVARDAAAKALGPGQWVAGVREPYLYWSNEAKGLSQQRFSRLRSAVLGSLGHVPGIARVYDVTILPKDCPPESDQSLDALVCRSVRPGIGGDYYIALAPGYFFDTGYAPGCGTSHGNAATYDRSVPVLARAPGSVTAGRVVDEAQSFEIYSRLLKEQLGLGPHAR